MQVNRWWVLTYILIFRAPFKSQYQSVLWSGARILVLLVGALFGYGWGWVCMMNLPLKDRRIWPRPSRSFGDPWARACNSTSVKPSQSYHSCQVRAACPLGRSGEERDTSAYLLALTHLIYLGSSQPYRRSTFGTYVSFSAHAAFLHLQWSSSWSDVAGIGRKMDMH